MVGAERRRTMRGECVDLPAWSAASPAQVQSCPWAPGESQPRERCQCCLASAPHARRGRKRSPPVWGGARRARARAGGKQEPGQ